MGDDNPTTCYSWLATRTFFSQRARPLLRKLAENGIEMLPISIDHLLALERLPMHHRDPFDRMLIAQSLEENLPIVTSDPLFARYDVHLIW
jgi:PIN domain nuclease of toxin-antitoxin system